MENATYLDSNPLFIEGSPPSSFAYEQHIQNLQRELQHHKDLSDQLQQALLDMPPPIPAGPHQARRKYSLSDESKQLREFVKQNMDNPAFAQDLVEGKYLSDIKPTNVPRALLRAYITYRYQTKQIE